MSQSCKKSPKSSSKIMNNSQIHPKNYRINTNTKILIILIIITMIIINWIKSSKNLVTNSDQNKILLKK